MTKDTIQVLVELIEKMEWEKKTPTKHDGCTLDDCYWLNNIGI